MRALIFSNLFIGAAAALLTHQSFLEISAAPAPALLALVFFATVTVYNLDRLVGAGDEDRIERTARHVWIEEHRRRLWALVGVCGLGVLASLVYVAPAVILALVPLGALSVGYSLPVLFGRGAPRRLKDVAGLKIFLIAGVWAFVTAILPVMSAAGPIDPASTALLWAERFLFIFAITLPFDVRDMERDRQGGLRTLPMMLGLKGTRGLIVASLAALALIALWHHGPGFDAAGWPLAGAAAASAALAVYGTGPREEMYYVGWLDGTIIAQWALVAFVVGL